MNRTIRRGSLRTKGAVILSTVLLLGLASTALAGSGIGGVFNLGVVNTVNALTTLTGSLNARLLQVTNTSTGAGAGAIGAINKGAGASTIRAQNDGNGPALGLFVTNNVPPIVTNSNGKVTNLNADSLDGLDSSNFLPANGTASNSLRLGGQLPSQYMSSSLFRVESALGPGLELGDGTFRADVSCPSGSRLLSGGPANIRSTSTLLESFPANTTIWAARIQKNGNTDDFSVVALCAAVFAP